MASRAIKFAFSDEIADVFLCAVCVASGRKFRFFSSFTIVFPAHAALQCTHTRALLGDIDVGLHFHGGWCLARRPPPLPRVPASQRDRQTDK